MNLRSLGRQIAKLGVKRVVWGLLMVRLRPWLLFARVYRLHFSRHREFSIDRRFELCVPALEEFDKAYRLFPTQLIPADVHAALARGDICMAAFDRANDTRMVGFIWAGVAAPHGDGLWAAVDPPAIYGYKAYVDPVYRGQGLNIAMIVERDRVAATRGFNASVGFVETHNYPSIRSNVHLGSERVGYAGYVKAFGRVYPFRSPRAKRASFRFYREGADRRATP